MTQTPNMLTTAEAAAILRESPITTMRRCARGQLPATKVGRHWLISRVALDEFLKPTNGPEPEPIWRSASHKRQARREGWA